MKNHRLIYLLLSLSVWTHISVAQPAANVQTLYDEGVKLKADNKVAEALEKFKQVLTINAKHSGALYESGWCQNDLKNYSSALDYLRKARATGLVVAELYSELGYAFEKLGMTDSAIVNYNKCIALNPDYASAYKRLGDIAYQAVDNANALLQYKKYEELSKTEITDYLFWYHKGFLLNATGDYANAKISLQKSLGYKNDYLNTHLELGFGAFKLKQDDDAINYYKAAMAVNPKSHVAYNGIAEVYRDNKKDINESMNWYRKSLEINPLERKANFGMGYGYNSQQKYIEAIDHLKKAIQSEPTYTAAYVELGYSYSKTGKESDAEIQFNRAIELNPQNANARYYACLMFINLKNKAKAQKMVDELKTLNSSYVSSLQPKVNAL